MKRESVKTQCHRPLWRIQGIADDRMIDSVQVNSDLMRTASLGLSFDEGEFIYALPFSICVDETRLYGEILLEAPVCLRLSRLAASTALRGPFAKIAAAPAYRPVDSAEFFAHIAPDVREISFMNGTRLELLLEA